MKVISLIQPWATLIAIGEKKLETRSWRTKFRGELAIHASKKINKAICRQEPFHSKLSQYGYTEDNLPTGVILAVGRLADCFKVIENKAGSATLDDGQLITGNEYYWGDYSEGRFAWEIVDVKALPKCIRAKGKLGLWEYPL